MASMRVHELAKEFDMSSGDLLDRLKEMKIPAKSHASMLNDAYVDKIRKNLEPEIRARAGEMCIRDRPSPRRLRASCCRPWTSASFCPPLPRSWAAPSC